MTELLFAAQGHLARVGTREGKALGHLHRLYRGQQRFLIANQFCRCNGLFHSGGQGFQIVKAGKPPPPLMTSPDMASNGNAFAQGFGLATPQKRYLSPQTALAEWLNSPLADPNGYRVHPAEISPGRWILP